MNVYFGYYCGDDDVLFRQLSFLIIQPLKYHTLKAKIKHHSSIKASRLWSQHLCLSKIKIDYMLYIDNLYKTQTFLKSGFLLIFTEMTFRILP